MTDTPPDDESTVETLPAPPTLEERVLRVERLLSLVTVAPRANPPVTIGPFTNVPAPGSPIRSDWPQQISQWVTTYGYGYIGYATRTGDLMLAASTWTTVASAVGAGVPAGKYLGVGILNASASTSVIGSARIETADAGTSPWFGFVQVSSSAPMNTSVVIWPFTKPAAGAITCNLGVNPTVSGLTAKVSTSVGYVYLGA